jgi:S-DNA-T family DNA segregation ATPase FtsK/SpoIIIE
VASNTISRRISEFVGVVLFASALLWLISLASYSPSDPAWFFNTGSHLPPANFAGRIGAFVAELSYQLLGYAAYVIPLVLVVAGWHYFWCRAVDAAYTKLTGAALLFGCMSSFLSLAFGTAEVSGKEFRAGGFIGEKLAAVLSEYLNRTGSIILILTLLFLAIILSTQFSFGRLFSVFSQILRDRWAVVAAAMRERREEKRREKQRQEVLKKHLSKESKDTKEGKEARPRPSVTPPPAIAASKPAVEPPSEPVPEPKKPSKTAAMVSAAAAALKAASTKPTPPPIKRPAPQPAAAAPMLPLPEPEKAPAERRRGTFTLPPHALLDAPRAERKIDERELMDGARLLEDKCREFSVEGNVVQIHPGPVVTTYEFKPDAGVKYSKITGLADDLCLAMQAESVLIDRIPGKSTVGIQIPNPNREQISLRELLESDAYKRSSSKLTLALGKTIHGEPFVSDLATMPHLLIAGSTGTGKSVSVNAMLTSILFRATPDDVRFIMIDPKRLELGMYEDIPHLLTPVVVDPKLAANALRWAVREMEERYKTLAKVGVRNIEQYNRNIRAMQAEQKSSAAVDDDGTEIKTLPFIVVLIDELADLMMVASNEVEESIARLAQMARAVGIHLILATQRPSVDVITGLIKANLPARISFRVSSKIDSRTILDGNGAEQLLGKGDMLYLPPASSRFVRLHGPYISEQESARLASFLRKQGKPTYDNTITDEEKGGQEAIEFEKDELYDEAARIVVSSGQASISYLQRRLRIGFSRAARLVDMMEADGLVSGAAGGKPREVLVKKDYFDEVDAQLR